MPTFIRFRRIVYHPTLTAVVYFLAWAAFWLFARPDGGFFKAYFELFIIGLAVMHAFLLLSVADASMARLRVMVGVSIGFALVPALLSLPLGSADAYFYAALGRAWEVLGVNPFFTTISSIRSEDVILQSKMIHHGHVSSQYGPTGLFLFGSPWFAGMTTLKGAVFFLKFLVAVFMLGLSVLLARSFFKWGEARYWWVILALLNPFVIAQVALDAHKEIFILLPFLLGLHALLQKRWFMHALCNAAVASISIYYVVYQAVLHVTVLLSPSHAARFGKTVWQSLGLQLGLLLPAYVVWQGADLRGVLAASAQEHLGSGALLLALRLTAHFGDFALDIPSGMWVPFFKPLAMLATAVLLCAVIGAFQRRSQTVGPDDRGREFLLLFFVASQALWVGSWYYQPWYALLGLVAFAVWCGLKEDNALGIQVYGVACALGALHAWSHWSYVVALAALIIGLWCAPGRSWRGYG